MSNPWSRDAFSIERQAEILHDPEKTGEAYGMLLDAGWPPHEATRLLVGAERGREMAESMRVMDEALASLRTMEDELSRVERNFSGKRPIISPPILQTIRNPANIAGVLAVILGITWLFT